MNTATNKKFTAEQIETILSRLVPIIAAPEDHSFFRGVLALKLESCNSAQAARFVSTLLRSAGASR